MNQDTVLSALLVFSAMLPIFVWLLAGRRATQFERVAFETVYRNMQDPVVVVDDQCRVTGLNHAAEDLLSVTQAAVMGEPLEDLFGGNAPKVFNALQSGKAQKMTTSTGRFLQIKVASILAKRCSARGGTAIMFRDVSDVERAKTEVCNSETLLRTLIDHSVNGIVRLRWIREENGDRILRSIFANAAAGRFLGTDANGLTNCTAHELLLLATCGLEADAAAAAVKRFEQAAVDGESLDIEVRHQQSGRGRWLRMICEPVGDDIAATFVDITDSKARERHMESIATSDPLTGVLNRRGFERNAAERLAGSVDHGTGALLFIDLNGFKRVNDEFGHEIGDQLLKIAAERLRKGLRSDDIIGRPGGDEFVALVPDVNADIADKLAKRLTSGLDKPYTIGAQTLSCAASIGLALYPEHGNTLSGLLREADRAMYRAKARSRDATGASGADLLERAG